MCVPGGFPARQSLCCGSKRVPVPAPVNKAGSAAPLPAGFLLGKSLPLTGGCVGLPPTAAWVSGSPSPSSRPHGNLAGRLVKGKFAAQRGKFGLGWGFFELCSVLCCRLVTSAVSPAHPGRAFLGTKGKISRGAGRSRSSGRVPRGGGTGRNIPHQRWLVPGHPRGTPACPAWGGGWEADASEPPSLISGHNRLFSVSIYKHPRSPPGPVAPARCVCGGAVGCFPLSHGRRADSAAVEALITASRCLDPVNKSAGGSDLRR